MNLRRFFWAIATLGGSALLALYAGAASAQPKPIENPNGTVSGTIDGHTFDLPVLCFPFLDTLDISSHDQPIHNNAIFGGEEPAVGLLVLEKGFQINAFVGGKRYMIRRSTDTVEAYPHTLVGEVRASKIGKIDVDFTIDCPSS